MKAVGHKHIANEWRLFIDSNKTSLKEVLLHNGNEFPSIPVAYPSYLKECYEVMKMLLLKINYHAYFWSICSDFKVIAILLGLQTGYMDIVASYVIGTAVLGKTLHFQGLA